jgi:hypothetical protein
MVKSLHFPPPCIHNTPTNLEKQGFFTVFRDFSGTPQYLVVRNKKRTKFLRYGKIWFFLL